MDDQIFVSLAQHNLVLNQFLNNVMQSRLCSSDCLIPCLSEPCVAVLTALPEDINPNESRDVYVLFEAHKWEPL